VQNLENKAFKFRLCARSLSFKDLHAKSREHGTYSRRPWLDDPVLGLRWGAEGRASQFRCAKFSKIAYYLRDNGICINVICFEASGQQESGVERGVRSTHLPFWQRTRKRLGHPLLRGRSDLETVRRDCHSPASCLSLSVRGILQGLRSDR
jgi:hypothetical protein